MKQASAKDGRTRKDLRLDFYNQMTPITRIQEDVWQTFESYEADIDYEESTIDGLQIVLYERIEITVDGKGKVIGEPEGSAIKEDAAFNVSPDIKWLTKWEDGSWLPTYYLGEALDRLADYDSAYDVPSN